KDAARRNMTAIIYRDGRQIHVYGSHPNFVEAKAEEAARLKEENQMLYQIQETSAEKQERLAQELMDELNAEMSSEADVVSKPKKRNKGKSAAKKRPRTKQRANRVVNDSSDETTPTLKVQVEVTQPQPSISQPQLPNTFNPEEVKAEQVEYDFDINSLVFPKYRLSPDRPRAKRSIH
ncbi:hypothetical protein ACR2XN_28585, partial [Klebsiella pneumoniae]